MKKISLYSLLLAGIFATSCNEDFNDDIASPQTWEQEAAIAVPSLSAAAVSSIDLKNVTDSVNVLTVTSPTLPEGTYLHNFKVKLTTEDASKSAILNAGATGKVAPADLQTSIEKLYGKRPTERTMSITFTADLMKGTQAALVATDALQLKATPKAPFISSGYYLIGDMTNSWDAKSILKFAHSDVDVYEDPVFTLIFTATDDNQYWKLVTQTNVEAGDIWGDGDGTAVGVATNGDTSMSGSLVAGANAAKIEKAGMYRMTINMLDYTYELKEITPLYYLVGNIQGWSDSKKNCIMYPTTAMIHSYTTNFSKGGGMPNFKLWLGTDFGKWSNAYGSSTDGDTSLSGSLIANKGAIQTPTNDIYTFTVDMSTLTYTLEKYADQNPATYEHISLIGEFNGWGKDEDLTEVAPHNWYIENFTTTAGELKFRANHAWVTSWGAKEGFADISVNSYGTGANSISNFVVPAGTYNIFFNDITGQYVFVTVE